MKRRTRLTSNEQQQTESAQEQKQEPLEFETADDLLRFDAAQTTVPPALADRLQQSIGPQGNPDRPWWKRWLGK